MKKKIIKIKRCCGKCGGDLIAIDVSFSVAHQCCEIKCKNCGEHIDYSHGDPEDYNEKKAKTYLIEILEENINDDKVKI